MRHVTGHCLFFEANSFFPRATPSENCLLLGTDNVRGQISVHIFAPNGSPENARLILLPGVTISSCLYPVEHCLVDK